MTLIHVQLVLIKLLNIERGAPGSIPGKMASKRTAHPNIPKRNDRTYPRMYRGDKRPAANACASMYSARALYSCFLVDKKLSNREGRIGSNFASNFHIALPAFLPLIPCRFIACCNRKCLLPHSLKAQIGFKLASHHQARKIFPLGRLVDLGHALAGSLPLPCVRISGY